MEASLESSSYVLSETSIPTISAHIPCHPAGVYVYYAVCFVAPNESLLLVFDN